MDLNILIRNGWEFGVHFSVRKSAVSPYRLFDTVTVTDTVYFFTLIFSFHHMSAIPDSQNPPFPVLFLFFWRALMGDV